MGTRYLVGTYGWSLARWQLPKEGSFLCGLAALPNLPAPASGMCPPAPSHTALPTREWGKMSPSNPKNALDAWTTCSLQGVGAADWPGSSSSVAPVTSCLLIQTAKSWCSLQQLHTAVYPRNITRCYLLRERSIMQVKPCWARPYFALTLFVIYRTTKLVRGRNKFCKCGM